MAYYLTDYRLLHAAIAVPSLIFLSYWWSVFRMNQLWRIENTHTYEISTLCKLSLLLPESSNQPETRTSRCVPESARWLVTNERYEEADHVLTRAAKINKSYIPAKWLVQINKPYWESIRKTVIWLRSTNNNDFRWEQLEHKSVMKNTSFGAYDLIRTPQMRKRTLISFFLWWA